MISRRFFLAGTAATLLSEAVSAAPSPSDISLWPATPPGGGGPPGPVKTSSRGAVSNIAVPSMEIFPAPRPNGAAMLVAAGGGYKRIEMANEARPAARWLAARGITAFVLSYRLPGEGWGAGPMAPLQDAQRALRLIRARAGQYGIHRYRIGVLGFSAGGHLLGLATTRASFLSYEPGDDVDKGSARPDAAALIYPIITLKPPYDRTSTRRVLIGDHPSEETSAMWSVETHVGPACPPMFLVQAEDDPVSNPENTVIMETACRQAGVPVERLRLGSGGHGFGMGVADTPTAAWPDAYEAWLRKAGMLG